MLRRAGDSQVVAYTLDQFLCGSFQMQRGHSLAPPPAVLMPQRQLYSEMLSLRPVGELYPSGQLVKPYARV